MAMASPGLYVPCGCGGRMSVVQSSPVTHSATLYAQCVFQCDRCQHCALQDVSLQLLQQQGLWTPPHEPKPEPAPEPEKVIEGAVVGYRAWRIKDWALTGTGVNRAWHSGVNEATCDPGRDESLALSWSMAFGALTGYGKHAAPAVGCHCGITALARFAENDEHWSRADVHGAIEAWSDETIPGVELGDVAAAAGVEVKGELPEHEHGRFILHGTGFRAQYGKVVLLAVDDEWPAAKRAAVRALAQEHGADVCRRSHLEDAAKEHGQLVPDELLEWAKESEYEDVAGSHLPSGSITVRGVSGPLQQAMQQINWSVQQYGSSVNQLRASLGLGPLSPVPPRPTPGRKGIKQTLGYPGPPANPTVKARKGDRVRDKKGQVWGCVKGGRPGRWEAEEFDQGGA